MIQLLLHISSLHYEKSANCVQGDQMNVILQGSEILQWTLDKSNSLRIQHI